MTPSGKHENKAYILHVALDVTEGTTKKLRCKRSTAVTWVDGKSLEDKESSDKIDQMRNISKECYLFLLPRNRRDSKKPFNIKNN